VDSAVEMPTIRKNTASTWSSTSGKVRIKLYSLHVSRDGDYRVTAGPVGPIHVNPTLGFGYNLPLAPVLIGAGAGLILLWAASLGLIALNRRGIVGSRARSAGDASSALGFAPTSHAAGPTPDTGDAGLGQLGPMIAAARAQGGGPAVIDAREVPGLRDAVVAMLDSRGIDAVHAAAASHPDLPVQAQGDPADKLLKLKQLRDAGLITDSDFQQQKTRILGGL
jgi:hypothetical protein